MNAQTATLNLVPGGVPVVVRASQYDVGREFVFSFDDGITTGYLLPAGTTVEVSGGKPDNHGFAYGEDDGVIEISVDRATVTVKTTQQMTCVPGNVICQIDLKLNGDVIGTANFTIMVEKGGLNDETIISDTEIPVIIAGLEGATAEAEAAADRAEAASRDVTGWAMTSKSYAVGDTGTRQGEDADNAKYYKEQAQLQAQSVTQDRLAAEAAATLSQSYAVGGTSSRTGEDTDNSKYYSEVADDKATLAESWAVGGTGTRTGEDTNNSKYWAEYAETVADVHIATTERAGIVKPDGTSITVSQDGTIRSQSGHEIYDSTGTMVQQKTKMQFNGSVVENVGDKTIVTNEGVTAHTPSQAQSTSPIGMVTSFNGRGGQVTPQSGDYTAAQVGAIPSVSGLQGQFLGFTSDNVVGAVTASPSGVASFHGRGGAVMPASGDYTAAMVGALPTQLGTQGQLLGFVAENTVGAVDAPATGVTTFNGRTGAVTPSNSDYTAAMVGAVPAVNGLQGQLLGFVADDVVGAVDGPSSMSDFLKIDGSRAATKLTVGTRGVGGQEGTNSFTAGINNIASGDQSQAMGINNTVTAVGAVAVGKFTRASKNYMFACGYGNKDDSDALFEVGMGTGQDLSNLQRLNMMKVDNVGNCDIYGVYKIKGNRAVTYSTTDIGVGASLPEGCQYLVYQN